jgi:hypothetical protein
MVLGMSIQTFTMLHVIISLVGIVTGLIAVWGMLTGNRYEGWTAVFLATTVLTSVTGFMFPVPYSPLLPSQIVGIISLLVLGVAVVALYYYQLAGRWRWIYVVSAVLALYLNVFVGVVQAFMKIPFFHALAPTQAEPPFAIAQGIVLLIFIGFGIIAAMKFHPPPLPST